MIALSYQVHIASGSHVLVDIRDFRLAPESITILFGESGIGKSMSALAVAGLLDSEQLSVRINGQDYDDYLRSEGVAEIRRNGFFVFQEPSSHLNPLLTLGTQLNEGNLAEAPDEGRILSRLWPGSSTSNVREILDVYPKPYRPSGGEKQRILAAMAFRKMAASIGSPPGALFIFDEPTGNLDNRLRNEFLDLLVDNFRAHGSTVLLITHDYSLISRFTSMYADLAKRINYKELSLGRGKLQLREFLPSEYLSWIGARKGRSHTKREDGVVMKLDPTIRVFGRTLLISRGRRETDTDPLVIQRGSMVYLKAPSGVGKTTLVKIIMGLQRAEKMSMKLGSMQFTEQTNRKTWSDHVWGRRIAMVFQHADEALNQNATVRGVFAGLPLKRPLDDDTIASALSEFFEGGVDVNFLARPVKYLSGGQKQRLNLLRSMVLDTELLILDEPLNGLDFESSVKVISRIEDRLQNGKSVLVISHNEEIFDALVHPEDIYYLRAVP